MSDSDEILFDDIYELHEVIGKLILYYVASDEGSGSKCRVRVEFGSSSGRVWVTIFRFLLGFHHADR